MKGKFVFRILVSLACALGIAAVMAAEYFLDVRAKNTSLDWSTPVRISAPGGFAYSPYIVADQAGNLHVAWSENVLNPAQEDISLDTIYYTSRRGTEWSNPVDIFAVSETGQARLNQLRIDSSDRLHMIWVSESNIIYATSPAELAGVVHSWQTVTLAEAAYTSDLVISPDGTLHIVYAVTQQGVYYLQSRDHGASWSYPVTIYKMPSDSYSAGNVRIEVDEPGYIHVAWGISSDDLGWSPAGIAYARSSDDGTTWDNTLMVMEGDNLPNIGFDGQGGLHLVWDNPANTMVGRGHTWSQDHGKTWREPERIFPGYRGQTGWPVMALDSGGRFHLIFMADSPELGFPRGYHTEWQGENWGELELVSGVLYGMEYPSMTVSKGNELDVVWFSYRQEEYGIWFTSAQTAAPFIPPKAIQSTAAASSATPDTLEVRSVPTVTGSVNVSDLIDLPAAAYNPALPISVSTGLVLVVIVLLIALRLIKIRRS